MLYLVKLEDLEQRYTIWMHEELIKSCDKIGVDYQVIDGIELGGKIQTGAFLDSNGTCYYKSSQLMKISRAFAEGSIQNGDTFLIYDMWFPGIEMIQYMAFFAGIRVKIVGIAHAGSWTPSDFITGLRVKVAELELHWMNETYDKILIGTEYHKMELLCHTPVYDSDKIVVTGLPFWIPEIVPDKSKISNSVIFASRPHKEKGFEQFLDLVAHDVDNEYEFFMTAGGLGMEFTDISESYKVLYDILISQNKLTLIDAPKKSEFYAWLFRMEFIFSWPEQENWGYSVMEAVALGCYPLLRDDKSYKEIFAETDVFLYSYFEDLKEDFYSQKIKYKKVKLADLFHGNILKGADNILEECL